MNDFGEFLYSLRKEKGITQAELAEKLGVTNKAVSKWETGEAMPETAQLLPISRIFDVSVDELLQGKRNERATENITESEGARVEVKERIRDNLFTRGEDDNDEEDNDENTLLRKIQSAVCSLVLLAGIITYLLLGIIGDLWHPFWAIIPAGAFVSGIVGFVFDLFDKERYKEKVEHGESPYLGVICGIIMNTCLTVFILLGAFLNLWHPLWVIPAVGGICCGAIAPVVKIIDGKRK